MDDLRSQNDARLTGETAIDDQPSLSDRPTIDAAAAGAVENSAAAAGLHGQAPPGREARLGKVREYQAAALKKRDPLAAAVATVNAGQMALAVELDECILQGFAALPRSPERFEKLLPGVQTYLQLTRQVARLAQIDAQATESRRARRTGQARAGRPARPR